MRDYIGRNGRVNDQQRVNHGQRSPEGRINAQEGMMRQRPNAVEREQDQVVLQNPDRTTY